MSETMQIRNFRKNRFVHGTRNGKMFAVIILIAAILMQMGGCSATELEDRCFPMLAVVDYRLGQVQFAYGFPELSQKDATDTEEAKVDAPMTAGIDFKEAVSACTMELDKKADCNHMKVLVLSTSFLEQRDEYDAMIEYLQQQELFPRNTYVCVTNDVAALLDTEDALPTDLGSYVEEYLNNHEKEHDSGLVNLGTIMDESENHIKTLKLPLLTVEEGAILWKENYTLLTDFS